MILDSSFNILLKSREFILKFYMVINLVKERRKEKMPKHGTNIRKRMDGRWEGRYRIVQDGHSSKYKSVYGKTCREVKEKLENIKQLALESDVEMSDSRGISGNFATVSCRWLENIKATRKYSTYIKYRGLYERHIRDRIGNILVSDMSYSLVNEKIFQENGELAYSHNLKHSIIAVVNQILKYAAENYNYPKMQLSNNSPCNKNKKIEIMNHTEQAQLVRYLYQEMDESKAGILLCIFTGLRLGEVCSLKWEDIDFDQMIIHVRRTVQRIAIDGNENRTALIVTEPKSTFSVREIPVSIGVMQVLKEIRHDEEYIVGGRNPLDPRTYQNRFKRYLKATAIKEYNFHTLRHTFATNCIDHDMDVKSLSEILGHANVQITLNKYVHPTMEAKRRQLAVLDSVYGQFCGNCE